MDITVQIIATAANHSLDYDDRKRSMRYRRGDIVNVYLTSDAPEAQNPNTRLGFIRVINVPNVLNFENIKNRLISSVHNLAILDSPVQRRRKWRFIIPDLLPAKKTEFLVNHETTITWNAFKSRLKRKVIVSELDASQDDESNALNDLDVS